MIIKCHLCKREFDKKHQLKDHERDAHPEGSVQFYLNRISKEERAAHQPKGEKP